MAPMPSCYSTAPDGTLRPSSSCRKTSRYLPSLALTRTEPGREHQVISARELAINQRLRHPRRHHRRRLRRMEPPRRSAQDQHIHRKARMGAYQSGMRAVGMTHIFSRPLAQGLEPGVDAAGLDAQAATHYPDEKQRTMLGDESKADWKFCGWPQWDSFCG